MALNSPAFVDAWLGAAKAGAVYVPINTEYKGDILRYQLGKADITHMVIDPVFLERLEAVIGDLPMLRNVILTAQVPGQPKRIGKSAEVCSLADVMRAPDSTP